MKKYEKVMSRILKTIAKCKPSNGSWTYTGALHLDRHAQTQEAFWEYPDLIPEPAQLTPSPSIPSFL